MRKLLTLALLLAVVPTMAQVKFTLNGTSHPAAKSLVVGDMTGKTQPETINVTDGKFTVTGDKPDQTLMTVLDRDNRMQSFFIVDGQELTLDMNTDVCTGSKLNERLSDIIRQMGAAKTETEFTTLLKKAIADNRDNVIAAFAMNQLLFSLSYDELKTMLNANDPYLQHPLCQQAFQMLKALELRAPGTMFRDVVENDTMGVAHHLNEYVGKGQYVLVDFWASWCGPCMQEMPNVKANYEKYHEAGFEVVGLSFDRSADAWKRAIREKELNWIHLSDLKFWQTAAAEVYGIRSIPSSILLDPKGMIIDVDLRGEKLGRKLQEIYGF